MAEVKVPELAESISEGTIAQWLKQPGEFVKKGDYIVELETDKVNVEIISDYEGVIAELKAEEGDTVRVGETIAVIGEQGTAQIDTGREAESVDEPEGKAPVTVTNNSQKESQREEASGVPAEAGPSASEKSEERVIASPAARKLAREKGISLSEVPAVDPLGRVRKQDVAAFDPAPKQAKTEPAKPAAVPAADGSKPVERIKMSRRRQTIANRLVEVQQTAAMLTTFNEVDMTNVMNLRKKWKDRFQKENDVRLGFMSFFTKAVVAALKKSPYLNAEIQGNELLLKKYYDIGVAVSTNDGLVVPVIRDADRKNFAELEGSLAELAEKARINKLTLGDLQGGTFTITNGGVFGSLMSTPILNGPQVGILGMHTIQTRPVAIDAERMENRPMMYIALSYDHRIVDGKEAVTFLKTVKQLIEDPESLLLGS
ncbi:2-oxoglutarate dehydrogenase complex dihydrolipoyllysine-residue succinyltransferase [Mesobacillus zeae]|uniref:Dihydrolipoyllysine-residue succinyltransferase component of 2-oxoglutarate dehydrogenase complex n=1 Tax=Mesobacillus zeae TaxID=1917180 RepID=A0A398BD37_9BACI|nr:2-oxoglutarate dehydrogenase complex dihydrolipoyllysine-residue succinyltransferase [Mesobacillus zeae]RID85576.1 2-oxoglutarate dehydrogenase complex dihydrolipoyllysine-residue succinyltransferase [Mesobacillus zeae]